MAGPSGMKRCYSAGSNPVSKQSSVDGKENSDGPQGTTAVGKKYHMNFSTRQGNELSKKMKVGEADAHAAKDSTQSYEPETEAATERYTELLGRYLLCLKPSNVLSISVYE